MKASFRTSAYLNTAISPLVCAVSLLCELGMKPVTQFCQTRGCMPMPIEGQESTRFTAGARCELARCFDQGQSSRRLARRVLGEVVEGRGADDAAADDDDVVWLGHDGSSHDCGSVHVQPMRAAWSFTAQEWRRKRLNLLLQLSILDPSHRRPSRFASEQLSCVRHRPIPDPARA